MDEDFGDVLHVPFGKRKERTRHFLKERVEMKQISLALSCLRLSFSITALWVTFSFPLSTNNDVNVQPTGKWIERISQSERALC